jgi:hypothetical protein
MERLFENLYQTNYGSTDVNRYNKEFRQKEFQLFQRRPTLKTATLPPNTNITQASNLIGEWMDTGKGIEVPDHQGVKDFFASPEFQNETKNRLTLSMARMRSIPNINVNQLKKKAQTALAKRQLQNACKFFTFAIDKLNLEKPIYKMNSSEKLEMAKLFQQKAFCNLKMGENNRSLIPTQSAIDDCAFVLETGVFEIDLIKSDHELFENFKQIELDAFQLKRTLEASAANNQRQRNRGQEQNREREYQKIKQTNNEEFQDVDATLCSKLAETEKKLAINASSNEDSCPGCMFRWCDFIDPTIAAILPCNHAICIDCLATNHIVCNDLIEKREFNCLLCRLKLSNKTLENVAKAFVKRNLIKSFNDLAKKLPFEQTEFEEIVVNSIIRLLLLAKTKIDPRDIETFDLNHVEEGIFNMVGLVDSNPNVELSSKEKQTFYAEARKSVELLHTEYANLFSTINQLQNTQSDDYREKKKQLKELRNKIDIAKENAARDIYERVNSRVISTLNDGEKCYRIDFHGQHDDLPCRKIIKEHVLPILDVVKKIMIVTGWGAHSENGKSILKDSIRAYVSSMDYKCEDVSGNKGAFYVTSKEETNQY